MHLATSHTYQSPQTTTAIVLVMAPLLLVVLGTYFVVAYRRNQRMAAQHYGGLTATEASLNRGHGLAIMAVLVVTMGLAVGTVLSPTVRDALASVGEQSRWLPFAFVPVALLYMRWLSRKVRSAASERAERAG